MLPWAVSKISWSINMRLLITALVFYALTISMASAQQVVLLCSLTTSGAVAACTPVSTTNPLPVKSN